MEYAEEYIALGLPSKGSDISRREHLLLAGYDEDTLIDSEFPAIFFDVWHWFQDLATTRRHNGYSSMPIEFKEMQAYFEMNKIEPDSSIIGIIRQLDFLSLRLQSESKK